MHYPSGNSYLNVQPEPPHSSTEEPLCSRDVVHRDTTRANSHKNANKRAHPGVASTQDHLQHWNNLSSEISLIPLSCTQTLLPPASLSTHIHTHGLSDARSNWLASEAWVSSGSSVALWEEVICYIWKPLKPTQENIQFHRFNARHVCVS